MIIIPICKICKQYYSSIINECPHCTNEDQNVNFRISPKIQEIKNKIALNDNNNVKKVIPRVNPPPIPPKTNPESTRLFNNLEIELQKENKREIEPKKTILYRRGTILVFEPLSFELFLQQPWIKKVLNELQISFERKFINENDQEHIIITVLRLKIIYVNSNTSVKDFFSDKTIHDEMSFRLINAYVIVKDSPLTEEWHNFLLRKSENRFIYYLSRVEMDQNHYKNFTLMESEQLFVSLIKRLLIIQEQVEISIVDTKRTTRIIDSAIKEIGNIPYKTSKLSMIK